MPNLVKKAPRGALLKRNVHVQSGPRVEYLAFLLEVPSDFGGVDDVVIHGNQVTIKERSTNDKPRELRLSIEGLLAP